VDTALKRNPGYPTHMGETREQRISQFLEEHDDLSFLLQRTPAFDRAAFDYAT
jgi:hypothetical protein